MEYKFRVHLCAKQEEKKMTEICKVAQMLTIRSSCYLSSFTFDPKGSNTDISILLN